MNVEWTVPSLKRISQIKSKYFSTEETDEYRIKLVERIEERFCAREPFLGLAILKTPLLSILINSLFHSDFQGMVQNIRLQR